MGRKRKLTDDQLQRLQERHIAGESIRSLAKESGIGESSLRALISAQSAQIKSVANQMVSAERAFNKLPISAQISAKTLASKLMRVMDNMASGAELASGSYLRLMMAHNAQAQLVDESDPMGTKEGNERAGSALLAMAALGKLANQAAEVPMALVNAMKDGIAGEEDEDGGAVIRVVGGLPD
jgi:lambda repressor-like predicted transcriptional regulator